MLEPEQFQALLNPNPTLYEYWLNRDKSKGPVNAVVFYNGTYVMIDAGYQSFGNVSLYHLTDDGWRRFDTTPAYIADSRVLLASTSDRKIADYITEQLAASRPT